MEHGEIMSNEKEHNMHEQAAYEAALVRKEKHLLEEQLTRYKQNIQATLPVVNPKESDFPGCVEWALS